MTRVAIRAPTPRDRDAFIAAMRESRALHRPWVSAPDDAEKFAAYLARLKTPDNAGFLVVRPGDGAICGVVNVNEIVRGALESAYLGYYGVARFAGQGYMREGLGLVVRHAFGVMKLHRLEANIQPRNERSIALVRALGFRREGFSPRYLKILGRWRDHERWAILADR